MFDFNNTLGDIDKLQDDNINDISLKLMNPCEIFYYMYGIPFKGIPIGNNGFYEITNISPHKYYLYNQSNNSDTVYSDIVFEYILYQHLNAVELNTINHKQIKELHLRYSDFISPVFSNEYFTVLWVIPRNNERYAQYFIKCNKLPTIEGTNYYDVLNKLPNTLNYIASYRKIFRLDEKGSDLAVCNKILNDAFFFCKNNNKAYFIYYIRHLDFLQFFSYTNLTGNIDKLQILLGTNYDTTDGITDNIYNSNLPVTTKSAIINGKDTNITISDKVYDEVPSYVQKIYKSQLGINKDSKNSDYTMRAIVIDL